MLPYNLPLEKLDNGIRNLVININRIPEVYTDTTSEGQIWRDCPAWPTKDGWMHFNVREWTNEDLVPNMREFLEDHPIFQLKGWGKLGFDEKFLCYTMSALFESHENGGLFKRISENQQRDYFRRAETRLIDILKGWGDLDKVVIQYLTSHFGKDYQKMPYRETGPLAIDRIMLRGCSFH